MTRDLRPELRSTRSVAQLRAGRSDWYRIENFSGPSSQLYIYDEIGYFGVTAQDLLNDLAKVQSGQLDVHLNSPGGDVFDGIAILEALRKHPANITMHIDSLAASIASVIAMAGDEVVMGRSAMMMIHDGHGVCIGNHADMVKMADLLDRASNTIASVYAERAGGSAAEWRELMRSEKWYSAEEAVAAGLADRIDGEKPAVAASFDLSIFRYAGRDEAPAPTDLAAAPVGTRDVDPDVVASDDDFDAVLFRTTLKEALR